MSHISIADTRFLLFSPGAYLVYKLITILDEFSVLITILDELPDSFSADGYYAYNDCCLLVSYGAVDQLFMKVINFRATKEVVISANGQGLVCDCVGEVKYITIRRFELRLPNLGQQIACNQNQSTRVRV